MTDVIDWLSDSDPSIRWQVLADLTGAPPDVVDAERSRVASEGWGARLLGLQQPDGSWSDVEPRTWLESPDGSTTYALTLLRHMGLDPASQAARDSLARVKAGVTYIFQGAKPYFGGETEVCVNGMVLAVAAYFGEPDEALIERLLGEQLDDGGWNCEAPPSVRSSFHSTICVLEALLELEKTRPDSALAESRKRGEGFMLERGLLRRKSDGEIIDEEWTRFSFPCGWHYDVLRGLDYLRSAGVTPDERVAEAVDLVAGSRQPDGRWLLGRALPGLDADEERFWNQLDFGMHEAEGEPSRWVTLRALRVLDWAR